MKGYVWRLGVSENQIGVLISVRYVKGTEQPPTDISGNIKMSSHSLVPFFDFESVTREMFDKPEVYEYILNQPNEFARTTELGKLTDAGRRVGVLNVVGRNEAYLKSISTERMANCALSNFKNPPNGVQLQVGDWNADETGIWQPGFKNDVIVAFSHPIVPVERFVNIDTGTEKTKLEYWRGKGRHRNVIVDNSLLASRQSIVSLADFGVSITSETSPAAIRYIQNVTDLNYDLIPVTKSTSRLGWVGKDVFLPYDENIVFDGEADFKHLFDATQAEGDFQAWLDMAREARRKDVAVRIAMAASFASVLLAKTNTSCVFTHFWSSESATGKTVILMLAASVWGDPELGKLTQSFNTTEVASELTCAFLNSIPLILDELQLARNWNGKLNFNVYKISQGSGKARGKKTGGVDKTTSWRLCCITSGETPLTIKSDGAGALARIVDIQIMNQIFDLEDGQRITKAIRANHGHAGRMFVEKLIKMGDEELQTRHSQIMKDINHANKIQDKQRMAAAALLMADEIADEVIFHDEQGRLTFAELEPYLLTTDEIAPATRAYEEILNIVSKYGRNFNEDFDRYDHYGFTEVGWIYILRTQFDEWINELGFSSRAILSAWTEQGLIQTQESKDSTRFTVRRSKNGKTGSYVKLKTPEDNSEDYL